MAFALSGCFENICVASFPQPRRIASPPGCLPINVVTSYTFALRISQQDVPLLCCATSAAVNDFADGVGVALSGVVSFMTTAVGVVVSDGRRGFCVRLQAASMSDMLASTMRGCFMCVF